MAYAAVMLIGNGGDRYRACCNRNPRVRRYGHKSKAQKVDQVVRDCGHCRVVLARGWRRGELPHRHVGGAIARREYCEVEITAGGPLHETGAEYSVYSVGKSNIPQGFKNCGQRFADLGQDGWELVTSSARIAAGVTGMHKINYVFKRPVEEVQ